MVFSLTSAVRRRQAHGGPHHPDTVGTHVFFNTWMRHDTEAENVRVDAAMVRNLLDAVRPIGTVRHFALGTAKK